MKKHMLKETNDMRRLMNLPLLKEDFEETGVMGVDAPESAGALDKDEEDHGDVVNEATMEEKDAYCQKEFGKDYKDCDDKQKAQCDKECIANSLQKSLEKGIQTKTKGSDIDMVVEDSEGEETYNYGEDEGADEHREDEMEDELHHDKEDMAPHDRIKAIEDHLDALKKDMGYDEDHEDRDEEGTHFAEGKRYSKVLNSLTESQYRKLKRFINEGPTASINVDVEKSSIKVTDGNGKTLYEGKAWMQPNEPIKARFDANEIMTITIPGLMCESAMFNSSLDGGKKMPAKCNGDKIMFNVSHFGTEKLENEILTIKGNVDGGTTQLKLNMIGSSVKPLKVA